MRKLFLMLAVIVFGVLKGYANINPYLYEGKTLCYIKNGQDYHYMFFDKNHKDVYSFYNEEFYIEKYIPEKRLLKCKLNKRKVYIDIDSLTANKSSIMYLKENYIALKNLFCNKNYYICKLDSTYNKNLNRSNMKMPIGEIFTGSSSFYTYKTYNYKYSILECHNFHQLIPYEENGTLNFYISNGYHFFNIKNFNKNFFLKNEMDSVINEKIKYELKQDSIKKELKLKQEKQDSINLVNGKIDLIKQYGNIAKDVINNNPYSCLESLKYMVAKRIESIHQQELINKAKQFRKNKLIKKYGKYNGEQIFKGYISIGYSKSMVIESWGKPERINKSTYSFGVHEQWCYYSGNYVYFENGKVTSIQTSK